MSGRAGSYRQVLVFGLGLLQNIFYKPGPFVLGRRAEAAVSH